MESLAERRWPGTLPETLVCRTINLERLSRVISGRQQAINQCGPTQRDAPAIFITSGPAELADFLSPADLVDKYPKFYWDNVSPFHTAIRYLNVTSSGRRWIASLYSNVFRADRELRLSGPEAKFPWSSARVVSGHAATPLSSG